MKPFIPSRMFFIDYITLGQRSCADLEVQWLKCAEPVGLHRSKTVCKEVFDDYMECRTHTKEYLRMRDMTLEKMKQGKHVENPTFTLTTDNTTAQ